MGIRSGADDFEMCNKLKGEVIICLRGFFGCRVESVWLVTNGRVNGKQCTGAYDCCEGL